MESLSIGKLANLAGLRPSALRYYEDAGLIPPPVRVNGRRRYNPSILRLLGAIRCAQDAGFTLDEIRALLHPGPESEPIGQRWEAFAQAKLRDLDAQMERLAAMKRLLEQSLACGCVRLEDCPLPQAHAAGSPLK